MSETRSPVTREAAEHMLRAGIAIACALACVATLACSSTAPDDDSGAGNGMSFSFSGDTSGSFASNGVLTFADITAFARTPSAGAVRHIPWPPFQVMVAFAWSPTTNGNGNGLTVYSAERTGTFGMAWGAGPSSPYADSTLADVTFYVGAQLGDTLQGRYYRMDTGQLTITERTATRVRGTFTGSGNMFVGIQSFPTKRLTITNGVIDLGTASTIVNSGSSLAANLCSVAKLC